MKVWEKVYHVPEPQRLISMPAITNDSHSTAIKRCGSGTWLTFSHTFILVSAADGYFFSPPWDRL